MSANKKKDLWYEFDNIFQFKLMEDPARRQAVVSMMNYLDSKPFGTLKSEEIREYLNNQTGKDLINSANKLASIYLQIFHNYLGTNFNQQTIIKNSFPWDAFKDFGYVRWHHYNWVAYLLNIQEAGLSLFQTSKWLS